jgi:hypothetical protein
VAYDRSDAREQRRNELAARLAEARRRAGHRQGRDWWGALPPLSATALLLALAPDAVLLAMGQSPPVLSTAVSLGSGLAEAIDRSPPFNDPPAADGASEVTTAGPTLLTLTGRDPEGAQLTVEIVRPPAHGTLVVPTDLHAPLVVEYRPAEGFAGDDVFAFVVDDGMHQSPAMERHVRVYLPAPQVPHEDDARAEALGGRDFDPHDPSSWRDARVTPDYLERAQQILDGHAQIVRTGQLPGRRDEEAAPTPLMPPLVPTAELERGAR